MNFLKIKLLVIAVIMFAASSAFASLSYDVTIDTSSLNNMDGYIYLQFDPGFGLGSYPNIVYAQTGTATVSSFSGATLGAQDTLNIMNGSAVSGTLPSSVVFTNANVVNDYNQAITFGNAINFHLVLDGLAVDSPSIVASTFSVGLFGNIDGTNPLLTTSGTVFAQDTPTPLPAAAWLLGSGLMGLAGIRRRKE
jgi:hypothetical protein